MQEKCKKNVKVLVVSRNFSNFAADFVLKYKE